ncbi:MAG: hypothetical protein ACU0A8_07540 [Limimaricola soesokkakensis]|uniref:hypothetical protein n=1 Tax=Limimaricola soesokkakensis TaxID=1343159 RepID=UPI0040597041
MIHPLSPAHAALLEVVRLHCDARQHAALLLGGAPILRARSVCSRRWVQSLSSHGACAANSRRCIRFFRSSMYMIPNVRRPGISP